MDEASGSKEVGVVGVPLCTIHERPEPVDLYQPEGAEYAVEPYREVEEVQRQETQTVDIEGGGVHVVVAQFGGVRLQDTVLQVPSAEVKHDVHQVQYVRDIVQAEPH